MSVQSESEIGLGRWGERVANVPRGWSSRNGSTVGPADGLVEVGDDPDVREAVQVGETRAVWAGQDDARRAGVVGCRLQRHALERGVGGADVADRLVVERFAAALVEERLDERARCPCGREAPDRDGSLEAGAVGDPIGEGQFAARQDVELSAEERSLVAVGAVEEEQFQHQLGAEVADVLRGAAQPAPEGLPAARRWREEHPMRAGGAPGAAALGDVAELTKNGDRPVDEGPADGPDLPDVAVGGERAGDVPTVRRPLAQEPEHGPLGECRFGAGGSRHEAILGRFGSVIRDVP